MIGRISVNDADAIQGRDLFLESYGQNPDTLLRKHQIYLNIVVQMMPFLESFEEVNREREDEAVDPTNVPVERVFGVLKFSEKALPHFQFGLLAQHTMAKFNKVAESLKNIHPAQLEQYHSEISVIEKQMKQDHLDQQPIFSLLQEESVMRPVSLFFFPLIVKAQLTDQRFKPAAIYIMEHRQLLSRPDLSDRSSNLKLLDLCLKEHFGGNIQLFAWMHGR